MNGNVLIIEDEETIVNVLASILIANEYIPVIAKNGAQALTYTKFAAAINSTVIYCTFIIFRTITQSHTNPR